jgi:hypothetical protein
VGPRNLPDQLMGCPGLCPLDPISLNISTERAQGLFPKPLVEEWSLLHKRTTMFSFVCISAVRESLLLVFRKNR